MVLSDVTDSAVMPPLLPDRWRVRLTDYPLVVRGIQVPRR